MGETLRVAKEKLGGETQKVLNIVGDIRRSEIRLIEAELDALDSSSRLAAALGSHDENPAYALTAALQEAARRAYADAVERCEGASPLLSPVKAAERGGEEGGGGGGGGEEESFGAVMSPDIHIWEEEDDVDESTLSLVPREVLKIERSVKRQSMSGGSSLAGSLGSRGTYDDDAEKARRKIFGEGSPIGGRKKSMTGGGSRGWYEDDAEKESEHIFGEAGGGTQGTGS